MPYQGIKALEEQIIKWEVARDFALHAKYEFEEIPKRESITINKRIAQQEQQEDDVAIFTFVPKEDNTMSNVQKRKPPRVRTCVEFLLQFRV
jgi:hypothetical protein